MAGIRIACLADTDACILIIKRHPEFVPEYIVLPLKLPALAYSACN
jgi:hypothetical protein